MAYILGIDTGGTYTDSVLYDERSSKIIAKSKALTTYENLVTGIKRSIEHLDMNNEIIISGVSLSTTLATNAIVEGRGCQAGTILIGCQLNDKIPGQCRSINGGHDISGNEKNPLDMEMLEAAVKDLSPLVETFSVSSYCSVRNPEHEITTRDYIRETTGKPVVCGHELTSKLGFHERTVTAALNARILPTIEKLINSVKKVLIEKNIHAPLMIVKGDGSLMNEATALLKPIETILSGPASSIIGAQKLMNVKDALIVDIGGTTTDIALIRNKIPKIDMEGARAGGWHTRVKSARINTYGIGGDSKIQINSLDDIIVGPEKSIPFSEAGHDNPYLTEEIKKYYTGLPNYMFKSIEAYKLMVEDHTSIKDLSSSESKIVDLLSTGPHTYLYLIDALGSIYINHLVKRGVVKVIGLTPTDILHTMKSYCTHNRDTALAVLAIMSKKFETNNEKLEKLIFKATINKISRSIIESAMDYDGEELENGRNNTEFFINKILNDSKKSSSFNIGCSFNTPIIAIGAPVNAYMPHVSKLLNAQLMIPEHADVANALGAASGNVYEKISIIISPRDKGGAVVHSPWGREFFDDVASAKESAIEKGIDHLMKSSSGSTLKELKIDKNINDLYVGESLIDEENVFIESNIEISLKGKPEWC